jgi:hypothetical protein
MNFTLFPDELQNSCEIHVHWGCELPVYPPLRGFSVRAGCGCGAAAANIRYSCRPMFGYLFIFRVLILFLLKLLSHDKQEYLPKPFTHLSL